MNDSLSTFILQNIPVITEQIVKYQGYIVHVNAWISSTIFVVMLLSLLVELYIKKIKNLDWDDSLTLQLLGTFTIMGILGSFIFTLANIFDIYKYTNSPIAFTLYNLLSLGK